VIKAYVDGEEYRAIAYDSDTPENREALVWMLASQRITPYRMTSRDGYPSEFIVEFEDGESWEAKMTSFLGHREDVGSPLRVEEIELRVRKLK